MRRAGVRNGTHSSSSVGLGDPTRPWQPVSTAATDVNAARHGRGGREFGPIGPHGSACDGAPVDNAPVDAPSPPIRLLFRPSYGRSAMWLEPGMRRRRGPRRILAPLMAVLALAAAIAAVVYVVIGTRDQDPPPRPRARTRPRGRRATAPRCGSHRRRHAEGLSAQALRGDLPRRGPRRDRHAVRTGRSGSRGGRYLVPVTVRTRTFGTLKGSIVLPMVVKGDDGPRPLGPAPAAARPAAGRRVRRRVLSRPHRAAVLAADGLRLDRLAGRGARSARRPRATSPAPG